MSALPLVCLKGGTEGPMLVLLHGLGANCGVWHGLLPLVERDWPGQWIAPDMRGHGLSPHASPYSVGTHGCDVLALIGDSTDVTLLGHSMGGAVSIGLAATSKVISRLAVFSVKARWDDDLVARFHAIGKVPRKTFASKVEAADRYIAAAGLKGLVNHDTITVARGIVQTDEGWQLAADPATNQIAGVNKVSAARSIEVPFMVTGGGADPMIPAEELRDLADSADVIAGLGHNAHVEDPVQLWAKVAPFLLEGRT